MLTHLLLNVVITNDDGHIVRNANVADLDDVLPLHRKHPHFLLGVFNADGDMWLWVPEVKDWR